MKSNRQPHRLEALKDNLKDLTATERKALEFVQKGAHIVRPPRTWYGQDLSLGQRLADKIAGFGGSWTFILSFLVLVSIWIYVNAILLRDSARAFDPFPFILLNLFLSFLATLQAPIILMAQKRQDEKDRDEAQHDYEVNLKSELEIMGLHDKLDNLTVQQWQQLIDLQQEQIKLLRSIEQKLGS